MTAYLAEYRVRIRNSGDSADLLVVTSVRGDTAPNYPYLKEPPKGDGASFDPLSGGSVIGSYTVMIVDAITSGSSRVFTSVLEDANGRLQIGFLRVYIERRLDGGAYGILHSGYLTGASLVSEAVWRLTIQDPLRIQEGFELFTTLSSTTISSFLASWPNRGCVLGGPVKGSFLNMRDLGGWSCRVHLNTSLGQSRYWFEPLRTYGPGSWNPDQVSRAAYDAFAAQINEAVNQLPKGIIEFGTRALSTVADAYARYMVWQGLVLLVDDVPFRPVSPATYGVMYGNGQSYFDFISAYKNWPGLFALLDGQTPLTNGATVRVRALTVLPSELSPIMLDKHPVDWFTDMQTIAGVAVDTSAATALKQSIGTGLRYSERITGPKKLGELLKSRIYEPHQIAVRLNSSGQLVPFSTRIFLNTVPTVTIADANVKTGTVRAFEYDAGNSLQRITFKHLRQSTMLGSSLDSIIEQDLELTLLNGDSGALRTGTVDISVPGMVRSDASQLTAADLQWLLGLAQQLFDRFGRGAQGAEMEVIRGDGTSDMDLLVQGQEVLVDVSQLPNHNKRLGDDVAITARAMQIVQITEQIATRQVTLVDSGPNANAISTKPTHTIAASSALPRTVAEVTITNAAALNALGYRVRIQMATGASPATTDFVDVYTSELAAIPTTAITLPAVAAGSKVSIRARSEKTDARPSDYQTAVAVTLTALSAATGLAAVAVAGDGSVADLSWTIGTNASEAVTDILARLQGSSISTAQIMKTLLAGSTRYRVDELTPNTAYTLTVRHRDMVTGDVSADADVNVTTDAATRTLSAPTNADGFSFPPNTSAKQLGVEIPDGDGKFGIAVIAAEQPGYVEVAEALETAVASGLYGAYSDGPTVPSIAGDWTVWSKPSPNDGLRRKLKARHVKKGCTSSAYTSEVVVNPAVVDSIPIYPTAALMVKATVQSSGGTQVVVRVAVADPVPGANSNNVSIAYSSSGVSAVSPASPQTIAAASVTSSLATTGYVDFTIDRAAFGSGTGRVVFVASRTDRIETAESVDVPSQDAVEDLLCRAKVQTTSPTQVVVRVAVSDPHPGGNISVAYTGAGVGTIAPASPQTIASGSVTNNIDTTGTVDITVDRPAFAVGTGRLTITASRSGRSSSSDSVDVPAQERDTASLIVRCDQVSSTDDDIVIRVRVAAPNAVATVTVAYAAGGLSISPSSGGMLTPTSSLGTTGSIDYTITRPSQGSAPVRVSFTASATGYADATDGVDVYPKMFMHRAKATKTGVDSIPNNTIQELTYDAEAFDDGNIFNSGTDNAAIIAPRAGKLIVNGQARFDGGAGSYRYAQLLCAGSIIAESQIPPCGGGVDTIINLVGVADASTSNRISMRVLQDSGGNLDVEGYLAAHYLATG